ncbi:MAG: alanine dehydrogenase [Culicoidibacterales bacterium]
MKIGVIKEIKNQESRVGLTPNHVQALVLNKHVVYVEYDAGKGSGFEDSEYLQAGAQLTDASTAWSNADLIIKVKEPIETEYKYFRAGLIIYTYFHLASNRELTLELLKAKVTAVAYETVELPDKSLPLLTPMSEIAGKMAVQVGAHFLEKHAGGRGVLLSGIPGVKKGKVLIIGGGVVGVNAAKVASGMGAKVTLLDRNIERLRYLETLFHNEIELLVSTPATIEHEVKDTDLLIGAVLVTGSVAPKLVSEQMVKTMPSGSVIVDVAIDQGGCIATMDHYTTHEQPIYIKHDVIHYAVANMPGAVARTSTIGLTNATVKYVNIIADHGLERAVKLNPELLLGVNTIGGKVTCKEVEKAHFSD